MATPDDELGAIAQLIADGDDDAAFARVRARLGWPRGKELLDADVPAWLEKIILHALAKNPAFRFASMDAFALALRFRLLHIGAALE